MEELGQQVLLAKFVLLLFLPFLKASKLKFRFRNLSSTRSLC